jgi:hypothetical protein
MRLLGVIREAVRAAATAPDTAPPGPDFFHYSDPERFLASLAEVGLAEVAVTPVPLTFRLPDGESLWEMITDGTVRTAALLHAQPADALTAIHRLVGEYLETYRDPSGAGYLIPADALLASGVRL